MGISDRIEGSVENWTTKWADRLREFLSGILAWGLEVLMDVLGKAMAPKLKPLLDSIEQQTDIPPEIKPIWDELKSPTGEVAAMLGQSAGGTLISGAISKVLDFILRPIVIGMSNIPFFVLLEPAQLLALWLRGEVDDTSLNSLLHNHGLGNPEIEGLKALTQIRFDATTAIILYRRFYDKWGGYLDDLKHQGWDSDRIEALKDATLFYPSPMDLINWSAKEVFEPIMRAEYGLDDEKDELVREEFYKAGIDDKQIDNYWAAHWKHPALNVIFDLLHRGQLTDEDVYKYYRVVEIPRYWRDKLTKVSWDLPNRIEIRMMARYGLVDKQFIIDMLRGVGLAEEYREVAADMMLAMGIRTDLSTRFSKGWITSEEVRQELIDSGLGDDVQRRMFQWIVKNMGTDRVAPERDLTKAEIVKGVKKGVISPAQGIELLMELGYEEWEAKFKLEIDIGAATGSPEYYQEFKKITQLYRQSQGLSAKIPPDELIQAEKDISDLEKALALSKENDIAQVEIGKMQGELDAAKLVYHQINERFRASG